VDRRRGRGPARAGWVDRSNRITGAIYSQFLPFVTPPALQMYADFEQAVYGSR
jgi:hypothetical protein